VLHQGEPAARAAMRLAEDLRDAGLDVVLHCGGGSFKSQMKRADGSGAEYAVILGEDELAEGAASVKALRAEGVAQRRVAMAELPAFLVEELVRTDGPE